MFKVFEIIFEVIGWLKIVASPSLIALGIAAFIYFPNQTDLSLVIAIIVAVLGLIIGIVWANHVWKKYGTMRFLSRIMATPELDNEKEKRDENYI